MKKIKKMLKSVDTQDVIDFADLRVEIFGI